MPQTDTLAQTVKIKAGCHTYALSFWLKIDNFEFTLSAVDTLKVEVVVGSKATVVATYSNLDGTYQYAQYSLNVSAFAGKTISVKFVGKETNKGGGTTIFALDDTALDQAP